MKNNRIYNIILSVLAYEATDEEMDVLEQWLEESETNRKEFATFQRIYSVSLSQKKDSDFNVDDAWEKVSQQTVHKRKRNYLKLRLSYAAMLAIIFTCLYSLLKVKPSPEISHVVNIEQFSQPTLVLEGGEEIVLRDTIFSIRKNKAVIINDTGQTLIYESGDEQITENDVKNNHLFIPKGSTYSVVLSDGTHVCLNSQSVLVYPVRFTGDTREVQITGEAYFQVANNENKPFIVHTDQLDIKVTGTSFNICSYEEEQTVSTVLVEGSISVRTTDGNEQTIFPAELFILDKASGLTHTQTVNTDIYTSWLNDKYIFRNTCLSDIIMRLQRWHDFAVVYQEENIKQKRFSVTVDRADAIDQLLEVISYTSDIRLERINDSIYVNKKGGAME